MKTKTRTNSPQLDCNCAPLSLVTSMNLLDDITATTSESTVPLTAHFVEFFMPFFIIKRMFCQGRQL